MKRSKVVFVTLLLMFSLLNLLSQMSIAINTELKGDLVVKEQHKTKESQDTVDPIFKEKIASAGKNLMTYPRCIGGALAISSIGTFVSSQAPDIGNIILPLTFAGVIFTYARGYNAIGAAGKNFSEAGNLLPNIPSELANQGLQLQTTGRYLRKAMIAGHSSLVLNIVGSAFLASSGWAGTNERILIPVSLGAFGGSIVSGLLMDNYMGNAGSSLSKLENMRDQNLDPIAKVGNRLKTYRILQYIGKGLLVGTIALIVGAENIDDPDTQEMVRFASIGVALGSIGCLIAAPTMVYSGGEQLQKF